MAYAGAGLERWRRGESLANVTKGEAKNDAHKNHYKNRKVDSCKGNPKVTYARFRGEIGLLCLTLWTLAKSGVPTEALAFGIGLEVS